MVQGPLPVLFTHHGEDWIRGSEVLLLDLLGALAKDKVQPIVWCNSATMANACRAAGHVTYQDDFRIMFDYGSPRPSAGHFMGLVNKGRALCRQHGVRVLHGNSLAPAQWLAPISATLRIPLLAHLHIDYLRRSRYVLGVHAATMVVGVSRQVLDGPIKDGVPPARTRIIYNGIDFSRMPEPRTDLKKHLGIASDALIIATVGSLIARKGHDVLIRAFALLSDTAHLIIAGDGPEQDSLQGLAGALGLAGRVHLTGQSDDVASVYKAADIFALASRRDAFGLALAEAGHFGLPCVSTRVGGIPEVIADGQTGLLTPPDDVPAFAAALARLAHDPALRLRLGAAARTRVAENFTASRMARQFEEIYAELDRRPSGQLGWYHTLGRLVRPYAKLASFAPSEPGYAS